MNPRELIKGLREAGYVLVKLPEERLSGSYDECSIEGGDEIHIERTWMNAPQARVMAADLLRAADQIETKS